MAPRKKAARVERRPDRPKWTVIDQDGNLKYRNAHGTGLVGFDEELARDLAAHAHPSHKWRAVPVADVIGDANSA